MYNDMTNIFNDVIRFGSSHELDTFVVKFIYIEIKRWDCLFFLIHSVVLLTNLDND